MTKGSIPPKYIAKTFSEDAWDEDKKEFFSLSNDKKWEWGFWVERQASQHSLKVGLLIGATAASIVFMLIIGYIAD